MFHSFFQLPSKVQVLVLLFAFFQFYSVVSQDSRVHNFTSSLFFLFLFLLLIIIRSGHLAEIWWSVCMSKFHRSLFYYYFTPLEFFTSVLADGFSLEFGWQQVSSNLQDSSQDSVRSQQCCHLDSLDPSANFQVFQAF